MTLTALASALLIFALRLTDVPIGTLKTMMMVRGKRAWATVLGLIEVTVWIMAMGRVMGQLDNGWNIAGYVAGYAAGTWLGIWIEGRLAFGSVEVHVISLSSLTDFNGDPNETTSSTATPFFPHNAPFSTA